MGLAAFFGLSFFFKNVLFCIYFLKKFFYFCTGKLYFIKNIYFEIIFLICSASRSIFSPFILFIQFHMYFYFYYLLLILINKFSRHKRILVSLFRSWVSHAFFELKFFLLKCFVLYLIFEEIFLFLYRYTLFYIKYLLFWNNISDVFDIA